jgi:hypothetical protein
MTVTPYYHDKYKRRDGLTPQQRSVILRSDELVRREIRVGHQPVLQYGLNGRDVTNTVHTMVRRGYIRRKFMAKWESATLKGYEIALKGIAE